MAVDPTEGTLIRIAQAMERVAKGMQDLAYAERDIAATMRSIEQMLEHSILLQPKFDDGPIPPP
jgi:hypothetical protein